jgi:hypothetical protein
MWLVAVASKAYSPFLFFFSKILKGYNLSQGKWGFNDIKRDGGRFLWRQIYNARRLGVRSMYGAMWDE